MSYTAPQWCRPPSSSAWAIDEIKSGCLLSTHPLTSSTTTFGRATDVVTIPTLHESCSRVHARIAFDSTGLAWLRDLGSGNGTTVNGKRLPSQSIGKEVLSDGQGKRKEGVRGVIVYPGDTIRFGASTRIYVLNGPEEYDRGAIKARMESAKIAALNNADSGGGNDSDGVRQEPQKQSNANDRGGGISWGMDMSDPTEEQPDSYSTAAASSTSIKTGPILESEVPEKHRKLYERLRTKQYKLQNLLEESKRIEIKAAHGELSDGQRSRLEQNRQRAEELRSKIEEEEVELREKIWGSGKGSAESKKKRSIDASSKAEDDDVDEFYDKTAEASRKRGRMTLDEDGSDEPETEQSLTARWKRLIADLKKTRAEVGGLQRRVDNVAAKVAAADAAGDDDAFFLRNDLELLQDNLKKMMKNESGIEEELSETEKLLRIVNDMLVFDRSSSFVGFEADRPKPKEEKASMMPPPPPPSPSMMQPPSMPPPERPSSAGVMMPPAPRPSPPGAAAMPPPPTIVTARSAPLPKAPAPAMAPHPPKRSKPIGPGRGPAGGTLAAIRSAVSSSSPRTTKRSKIPGAAPTPPGFADSSASKEDTWKAPEGQDGSGITKLNAKFAGRY